MVGMGKIKPATSRLNNRTSLHCGMISFLFFMLAVVAFALHSVHTGIFGAVHSFEILLEASCKTNCSLTLTIRSDSFLTFMYTFFTWLRPKPRFLFLQTTLCQLPMLLHNYQLSKRFSSPPTFGDALKAIQTSFVRS